MRLPKGRKKPFARLTRVLKASTSNKKETYRDISELDPVWENGPPVFPAEQRGPVDDEEDRARAQEIYEEVHQECWPVVAVVDIAKSVGDVSDLYTSDSSLQNLEDKVDHLASRYSEALKLLVERYREKEEKGERYREKEEGEPSDDIIISNSQDHSHDTRWTDDASFEKGNLYGDALNLMLNGELGGNDDDTEETIPKDDNEAGCKYFQALDNAEDFPDDIYRDREEDIPGRFWNVAGCGVHRQSPIPVTEIHDPSISKSHEKSEQDEDDVTTKSSFPYVSSSYECTSGEGGKGSVTSSVRRYVGATVAEVLTADKRRSFTRSFPVLGTRGSKVSKEVEISLESDSKALEEVTRDDEEDSIDLLFESAAQASQADFSEQSITTGESEKPVCKSMSAPINTSAKPTSKRIASHQDIGFSPLSPVGSYEEESQCSEFDAVALTDVLMDAGEDENTAVDIDHVLFRRQHGKLSSSESIIKSEQKTGDSKTFSSLFLFQKTASWECTPRVCGANFNKTRNEAIDTTKSHKPSDNLYREGLFSGNISDDGIESQASQSDDGWVCEGTSVIFTKRLGDRRRVVSRQNDKVPNGACSGTREFLDQRQSDCQGTRDPCESSVPTGACHSTQEFSPQSQYSCHVLQGGNTLRTSLCNGAQGLTGKRRSGQQKVGRKEKIAISKGPEPILKGCSSDGEKTVVILLKYQHDSDSDDEDGVANDEEPVEEQKQEQEPERVQAHGKNGCEQEGLRRHEMKKNTEKVEGQSKSKRIAIIGKRPRSTERVLGKLVMQVWRKRSMARRHFFELPSVAAPSSIRNEASMIDDEEYVQDERGVFKQVDVAAKVDTIERRPVSPVDGHNQGRMSQSHEPTTTPNEFDLVITRHVESGGQADYFKDVKEANCHYTNDPAIGYGHDRQLKKGDRLSSFGKKPVPVLLSKNKSLSKKHDVITKSLLGHMKESQKDTLEKQGESAECVPNANGPSTYREQEMQGDFINMTHTTEIDRISQSSPATSRKSKSILGSHAASKSLLPSHEEVIAEFSIGQGHKKKESVRSNVTEDFVRVVSDESASSKKSRTALVFKRWLKVGKKPVREMSTGNSREEEEESSVKTPSQFSDQDANQSNNDDSGKYDEPNGDDELKEQDEPDNFQSSKESYVMWIPESFSSMFVAQEGAKESDAWEPLPANPTKQQKKTHLSNITEGADIPSLNDLPINKIGKGDGIFEEDDDAETNTIIDVQLPYENDIQREESMISWISTSLSTLFVDPLQQVHIPTREWMVSSDKRPSATRSLPPLRRGSLRDETGTDREDWDNYDYEEDTETKDEDFLTEVEEGRVLNARFRARSVDDFLGYVADALFQNNGNDKTAGAEAEVVTDYEGDSTDDSFASSKGELSVNSKPVLPVEPINDKNVEEDDKTEKDSVQRRRGNVIALVTRARRSFTKRQSTKNEQSPIVVTETETLKPASTYTSRGESEDGDQSETSTDVDQSGVVTIFDEKNRSMVDEEQVSDVKVKKRSKSRRRSRRKETETRPGPRHPIEQRGPLDGLWDYFDFTASIDEEEWSDDEDSSYDTGMTERWTYKPRMKELSRKGQLSQIAEEVPVTRSKRRFTDKNGHIDRSHRVETMWGRSRTDERPPELSPLEVVQGTALSLGRQVSKVADGLAL